MVDVSVLQLSRYDRLGGSSRLRFYDFQPALAERGIRVTAAPFFDDAYLHRLYTGDRGSRVRILHYYRDRFATLLASPRYDLIWLEKEALPWLPASIELLLMRKTPFIIDFDDAWFHRYDLHKSRPIRKILAGKFPALVQGAAAVIAGSPYLAEWATAHGARKVVRIPTTVDLPRYAQKRAFDSAFTIGWMGSPSTTAYLHGIGGALEALCRQGASVRLVGSGPVALPAPTTIIPWTEATETDELATFDVGIMPLKPDAWSEGKCAYKLIQYMAAGLPVVASPVGMNREVVQHGVNGFLADSEQEWIAALETMRTDPGLRHSMGMAGRRIVEERYSLSGNADLLAQTLREAPRKS